MKFSFFCFLSLFLLGNAAWIQAAQSDFVVADIRVDGLKRVSAGTVFTQFPISIGDQVSSQELANAVKTLFSSGLFTDIALERESDDLIVRIVERPAISQITIEGNQDISEEDLLEGLKAEGMSVGKVFKTATLERLELEILRSYVAQGRYNATIETEVEEQSGNRVGITININEGDVAKIDHINFIGNDSFDDEELASLMDLSTSGTWTFFTGSDKYAKEKLSGDLEKLRSFYLDRGFVKFSIESTQVSISPDREKVFLTINIAEGPRYTVSEIDIKGDLILEKETLEEALLTSVGEVFSRQKLTSSADIMSQLLGTEGYTFAKVNPVPSTNEDNTVSVTFFIEPGRRHYVRRINFIGNINTADVVLRQEMLQMEGAAASTELIEGSKVRLERLGYFSRVSVDTPKVPGVDDQIDVLYTVEEQSSGSLSASLGFSEDSGVNLGLNISERNFLGTGKRVSFGITRSASVKSANLSYLNPYYTVDGVSRGFSVFARETDFDEEDRSDFIVDTIGANMTFGYPLSNITRLSFTLGFTDTKLSVGDLPSREIDQFINDEGDSFDDFSFRVSWNRSTLNRGTFPTKGWGQNLSLEVTLPGVSDLQYYKAAYASNFYYPLDKKGHWVVRMRNDFAYGRDYGSSNTFPFFEHYFAGGIGSVRGYDSGSLGPQDTPQLDGGVQVTDPDPFGGNQLMESSWELIFPFPFLEDQRSMRWALFVDAGNVFDTVRGYDPDIEEIRFTAGMGMQWITFIGPIGLSFARPLNDQDGDDLQFFQFSLGQTF